MRNYPPSYTTETKRKDGAHSVWIMRITIAGADYYLTDNAFVLLPFSGSAPWPAGITVNAVAAVKEWGSIQQGISGALGEAQVSEFSATLILGVTLTPSPRDLGYFADAKLLKLCPVEIYKWYAGCADPPQLIFSGRVRDLSDYTDTTIAMRVQDYSVDLDNFYIGRLLTTQDYPGADPAAVGKMLPIPFGPLPKFPALCVNATATYIYMYSDRAMPIAPNVYVRNTGIADIPINALCTTYTGQSGNQLAGYESKGVVSISAAQAASIQVMVQASIAEGNHTHSANTGGLQRIEFSYIDNLVLYWETGHDQTQLNDGNDATYGTAPFNGCAADYSFASTPSGSGTPTQVRIIFDVSVIGNYSHGPIDILWNGTIVQSFNYPSFNPYSWVRYGWASIWIAVSSWATIGTSLKVRVRGDGNTQMYAVYAQVDTAAATIGSSPASGVAISNPTPANAVSEQVLVDVAADLGTPTAIATWMLTQAGKSAISVVGALPVAAMAGLLDTYDNASSWLKKIGFQAGAYFTFFRNTPQFVARTGSSQSKNIMDCPLGTDGRRQRTRHMTDIADMVNNIIIRYSRDWSQPSGPDAYTATLPGTVGDGLHERPDLFMFDFITSAQAVATLLALYLAALGDQGWIDQVDAAPEYSVLEFGDQAVLTFAAGQTGFVIAAEEAPGSCEAADKFTLKIVY